MQNLLPVFLETAALLCAQEPQRPRTFLIAQASTISRSLLDASGLSACNGRIDYRVITEDRYSMMAACDACLATSGTVTLELALLRVPTVVAYRVAAHTYWLGRLIIRSLPFFSLPNLIAGREIVPELLQHALTPQSLLDELQPLLREEKLRTAMRTACSELRQRLGNEGASRRTAALALELMDDRGGSPAMSFLSGGHPGDAPTPRPRPDCAPPA